MHHTPVHTPTLKPPCGILNLNAGDGHSTCHS